MANTYTSNTIRVNNGDSTTFDTSDAADGIRILSAECRWRGVRTSNTSYNTSYSTNTNYDSATATTSTQYNNNSTSGSATAQESTQTNSDTTYRTDNDNSNWGNNVYAYWSDVDNIPSGATLEGNTATAKVTNNTGSSIEITNVVFSANWFANYIGDPGFVEKWNFTVGAGQTRTIASSTFLGSEQTGGSVSASASVDNDSDVTVTLKLKKEWSTESIQNDTVTRSYPSVPNGYSFHKHEKIIDGNKTTYYSNKVGQSVSVTSTNPNDTKYLTLKTYGKKTVTNSRTASTSFPSVPNGYNFSRHREEKSNGTNDYHYSNKVGHSRSITSNSPNDTVWVRLKTRGRKTTSSTSYYDTRDPSVSGNASASYNGTISDGNWSSWTSVSGFSPGSNTLNHSISESNKADFQIRYEWEYGYPTAIETKQIKINNTIYNVVLADPSDPALTQNFFQTGSSSGDILSFDIVDPSDPNAIPYYVYHPTLGEFALRGTAE